MGRAVALLLALTAFSIATSAQSARGLVVDQTGLALPGAIVQLLDGSTLVATATTAPDGTFAFDAALPGAVVAASLDGFETARVPRASADRIVLAIARATETTTVVASPVAASSPTAPLLGNTLEASTVSRLPSNRMKARESLPLLPSVVRGPDGLMQLGGARAHDTPLFLDGFNVTDPATGISSINLPFETVRGIDVLRDPMAIGYGGLLGGLVNLESRPGGDRFAAGVQGFVPRPRFASPGFGRIEGIFPRAYVAGSSAGGQLRYVAAAEYDFERIPVPNVTTGSGPDIVERSATVFTRVDAQFGPRHGLVLEALTFPASSESIGLSPRREEAATADVSAQDVFGGVTYRFLADENTVFAIQLGVLAHDATLTPGGGGPSILSPSGWHQNWFAAVHRSAVRYTTLATWERTRIIGGRSHDFTLAGEAGVRRLSGTVAESPVVVQNAAGRTVRTIEFGPSSSLGARDRPIGLSLRDVWTASERAQIDAGVRLDHSRHGGGAPSGRVGVRYALDRTGATVVKAGYGRFVGSLPLAVPAFASYPARIDRAFDPLDGGLLSETTLQPTVGRLRLPRALAATISLERQLAPGLDAQVAFTDRRSARLATLRVPVSSGPLAIESDGSGRYREIQVSMRRTLSENQQVFVSYVQSNARGDLNDFATVFQTLDAPILQPGGMSRLPSDARHRVLAWGTFNLPRRVVVSPVVEWRSGFPYSVVDDRYDYAGPPNGAAFPSFFATDFVAYKTFTVRKRSADVGFQLFNATNHKNPRDVYAVLGAPRSGQFTNSVGPILRGYMLLKW